jgi:hypothetical protein
MVHPGSGRISRVPPYSRIRPRGALISLTGLLPSLAELSSYLRLSACTFLLVASPVVKARRILQPHECNGYSLGTPMVWAIPRSLAATEGISFDVCSSGYLDVSVLRVRFSLPMYSAEDDEPYGPPGFPIRTSTDQGLFGGSPWLFAAFHVLHR